MAISVFYNIVNKLGGLMSVNFLFSWAMVRSLR